MRFVMPSRCLSADVEKAVGMTRMQFRRRVWASGVHMWTELNEQEGDHLGGELRVERKEEDHANNWSPGALLEVKDRKGTQSRKPRRNSQSIGGRPGPSWKPSGESVSRRGVAGGGQAATPSVEGSALTVLLVLMALTGAALVERWRQILIGGHPRENGRGSGDSAFKEFYLWEGERVWQELFV